MCIVFIHCNNDVGAKYKLIMAANRDEYMSRPTKSADTHPDFSHIICGIDMESGVEGGTWLGVTKSGKFSALTNVLTGSQDPSKLPRGKLVINYLKEEVDPMDYLNLLQDKQHRQFNMLAGKIDSCGKICLGYYSNWDDKNPRLLTDKTNVVACTTLNGDWKKIEHGRKTFDKIIENSHAMSPNDLTNCLLESLLSDTTSLYPDEIVRKQCNGALDDTILEKYCSVMISGLGLYGTRVQTVVLIDENNQLHFTEMALNGSDGADETAWLKSSYTFTVKVTDTSSS
ncbi:transport and Golgi organization 2 homolog [Styela clava]